MLQREEDWRSEIPAGSEIRPGSIVVEKVPTANSANSANQRAFVRGFASHMIFRCRERAGLGQDRLARYLTAVKEFSPRPGMQHSS